MSRTWVSATTSSSSYKAKTSAHYGGNYGEEARGLFDGIVLHPSTAVRFKVTEIFDQTPGPNAGSRIEF